MVQSLTNPYFNNFGSSGEQNLLEDLIIESIKGYGMTMLYIPRKLISLDEVLGEDRLSEFENAYPMVVYFENIDNFGGQGAFIQKFGMMTEQSATLVVSRKEWRRLVGSQASTIVPDRPNEGDLIYFPLAKSLFEIKFVQHQDPFYQIGKLFVFKMEVELFQYSSEDIKTGVEELDIFETLKTFEDTTAGDDSITDGYGINDHLKTASTTVVFDVNNPFGE